MFVLVLRAIVDLNYLWSGNSESFGYYGCTHEYCSIKRIIATLLFLEMRLKI